MPGALRRSPGIDVDSLEEHVKTMRFFLAALLAVTVAGGNATARTPASFDLDLLSEDVSPRAIVGFTHQVDAATVRRLAQTGITHMAKLPSIDAAIVLGPLDAYRTISTWRDVQYVDADGRLRMDNYGARLDTKVHFLRGETNKLSRDYTGKNVTVAIVDTGIDATHPDLADRVVKHVNFEPAWFMDAIQDGEYTDQYAEATGNGVDTIGHGTHVAGIVAGTGAGGQGLDFAGVAPEATLLDLKIADAHQGLVYDLGFETNALLAYEWLLKHRNDPAFPGGVRVASNSWGTFEADDEFEPTTLMVKAAYAAGVVSVFSAGNSGPDADTVGPGPTRAEEVITVGAICKSYGYTQTTTCGAGQVANFSSRGPQVDIVAPGVAIYSAMARPSVLIPLGGGVRPPGTGDPAAAANNTTLYAAFSGTSMSAPHVSGIVALMLDANPKLTPAQVESILIRTAKDRGPKGFDNDYGFGVAEAYGAVRLSLVS